jgi:hypothetical protein
VTNREPEDPIDERLPGCLLGIEPLTRSQQLQDEFLAKVVRLEPGKATPKTTGEVIDPLEGVRIQKRVGIIHDISPHSGSTPSRADRGRVPWWRCARNGSAKKSAHRKPMGEKELKK